MFWRWIPQKKTAMHLGNMKCEVGDDSTYIKNTKAVYNNFQKNSQRPDITEFRNIEGFNNPFKIIKYPFIAKNYPEWWFEYDKL